MESVERQQAVGPDRMKERPLAWLSRVLSIHSQVVRSLEWNRVPIKLEDLRREIPRLAQDACEKLARELPPDERKELALAVAAEAVGLGPLDVLLADPAVTDVLVNGIEDVFIERQGELIRTPVRFVDEDHLLRIIHRVASQIGRRVDESSPMVDARLPDGSRVHAVVRPLAVDGPKLSIRRFAGDALTTDSLIAHGTLPEVAVQVLKQAIVGRNGVLISGGTGVGKTSLLNAISTFIPPGERVVTIEDTAELRLRHPHVVSLETRTVNEEGRGQVTMRELVRASLRMRPDRIIIGEVRGDEVLDMLQAMNTGHPGTLGTIHANSARDALARLLFLARLSGSSVSSKSIRRHIVGGVQVLVHMARTADGVRRVVQVVEIAGLRGTEFQLHPLIEFQQLAEAGDDRCLGRFCVSRHVSRYLDRGGSAHLLGDWSGAGNELLVKRGRDS